MAMGHTPVIERIARVLAGRRASLNADGVTSSAADVVDATWRDYTEDALAVLKALREPDPEMVSAGDARIWGAMVKAALEERSSASTRSGGESPLRSLD